MTLTKPRNPLFDDTIELRPIAAPDVDEIRDICDADGFRQLEIPELQAEQLADDPCQAIWTWASQKVVGWESLDFPLAFINTCFAVRLLHDSNHIAGIVGFHRPNEPELGDGINVYYWTNPAMRRRRIASRGVSVGTAWALEAWEVGDAYIRATSKESEKVAENAGFKRTSVLMKGKHLFRFRAT